MQMGLRTDQLSTGISSRAAVDLGRIKPFLIQTSHWKIHGKFEKKEPPTQLWANFPQIAP